MRRYANIKKHQHQDGTKLDSKREYARYCDLLLLQRAGDLRFVAIRVDQS